MCFCCILHLWNNEDMWLTKHRRGKNRRKTDQCERALKEISNLMIPGVSAACVRGRMLWFFSANPYITSLVLRHKEQQKNHSMWRGTYTPFDRKKKNLTGFLSLPHSSQNKNIYLYTPGCKYTLRGLFTLLHCADMQQYMLPAFCAVCCLSFWMPFQLTFPICSLQHGKTHEHAVWCTAK